MAFSRRAVHLMRLTSSTGNCGVMYSTLMLVEICTYWFITDFLAICLLLLMFLSFDLFYYCH